MKIVQQSSIISVKTRSQSDITHQRSNTFGLDETHHIAINNSTYIMTKKICANKSI